MVDRSKSQQNLISAKLQWLLPKRLIITNASDREKEEKLTHFWWKYKLVNSLWKTVRRFLKNSN
jgi:hypothetical protein